MATMLRFLQKSFPVVVLLYFLSGCSSPKGFLAKAPEEKSEQLKIHHDLSKVNIPVELSVPGMEAAINKELSGLLYEGKGIKANDNVTLDLKVWKLDLIKLDVQGDEVIYTVPLKLWTNTAFKVSLLGVPVEDSREVDCAIELTLKSKISVDSLWNIQTKTSLEKYNWIQKPVIKVANFELPVGLIADLILKNQSAVIARTLDDQVKEQLNVKPWILEAWNRLQEPIKIKDDPLVWLIIKPVTPFMAPFSGKTGKLSSSVGISAYVESHFGDKPAFDKTPLPPLKFLPHGPSEFNISLIGDISYDKIKELAKTALQGQIFEFENGKYHVSVQDLDVYPVGEMLAVKTTLTGSLNGIVYLKGIPVYDSVSREIKLTQTVFDIETKNKLVKAASWLMHGTLEKKIGAALHYPLADQLSAGEEMIRKSLSHNKLTQHITLNGTLTHLSPKDIVLTSESIKAIVNAKGNLQVQVDGF